MRRGARALVALCALAAACSRGRTGLRVLVSTSYDPHTLDPSLHLERVVVRAFDRADPEAAPVLERPFVLEPLVDGLALPLEFNVVPRAGDDVVRFEVEGFHSARAVPGETPFVQSRVITRFSQGRFLVVPLVLYEACAGQRCGDGMTCGPEGVCVSAERPPESLAPFDPDAGPSVQDAPAPDAPDAALDTAPDTAFDTAFDAPPDAGPDVARDDAPPDAPPDAALDAPVDAPPDEPVRDAARDEFPVDSPADAGPVACPPASVDVRAAPPERPAGAPIQTRSGPSIAADDASYLVAWLEGSAGTSPGGERVGAAFVLRDGRVVEDPEGALANVARDPPADRSRFTRVQLLRAHEGFVAVWTQALVSAGGAHAVFARHVALAPGTGPTGRSFVLGPPCALPYTGAGPHLAALSDDAAARLLVCGPSGTTDGVCQQYSWSPTRCPTGPVAGSSTTIAGRTPVAASFATTAPARGFRVLARTNTDWYAYEGPVEGGPLSTVALSFPRALGSARNEVTSAVWLEPDAARPPEVPAGWHVAEALPSVAVQRLRVLAVPTPPSGGREAMIGSDKLPASSPLAIAYARRADRYRLAWCVPAATGLAGVYAIELVPAAELRTVLAGACGGTALLPAGVPWPREAPVGELVPQVTVEGSGSYAVRLLLTPAGLECL